MPRSRATRSSITSCLKTKKQGTTPWARLRSLAWNQRGTDPHLTLASICNPRSSSRLSRHGIAHSRPRAAPTTNSSRSRHTTITRGMQTAAKLIGIVTTRSGRHFTILSSTWRAGMVWCLDREETKRWLYRINSSNRSSRLNSDRDSLGRC